MKTPARFLPLIEILEARIAPAGTANLIWQGDVDSHWGSGTVATNTNWIASPIPANKLPVDGSALVFPAGAANKTNDNNIAGLDLKSLSFTGDGYAITGSAITLSGGLSANYTTTGNNAFSVPITLAADQTFAFSGNTGATFSLGQIDLGGKTLTVDNTFTVASVVAGGNGKGITGTGAFTKNGTGRFALSVNDFTGPVQVNAGILVVGQSSGLGAAGAGNGTTIASGASLVVAANVLAIAEDLTVSGSGAAGQPGALVLSATSSFSLNGALRLGSDATISAATRRSRPRRGPLPICLSPARWARPTMRSRSSRSRTVRKM